MSLIPQVTLASQLEPWPFGKDYMPSFFSRSTFINLEQALNQCKLVDGTFLKDAEANTNFGKAYRYWYMAPSDMDEWAELSLDAPQEVALVGRYLETVRRNNIATSRQNDPDWLKRDFTCCKKIATICLIAGIIGLFTTGIFLSFKYWKK